MDRHTQRFADAMPADAAGFDGEFQIDGAFSLRCTAAASVGDLQRAEYEMRTEYGDCRYTVLGKQLYFVDWGSYRFRGGLSYGASIEQPFVELHFQLRGATHSVQTPFDAGFEMQPGETNLVIVPAARGSFRLKQDLEGATFEVLLSKTYLLELADRHPQLLAPVAEKLLANRPGWLSDRHLKITPRIWGVIERIRRHQGQGGAGSLYLEAQILELLALQLGQLQRPVASNGARLSKADVERIHAARDLLLQRLDDPPSLAELARHALTNEFKLKRGFKQIFGTSPYAFLLQHKLELARSYLLDSDRSIADIARRVGYRDPAHLTHAFRRRYGHPPSELRRSRELVGS